MSIIPSPVPFQSADLGTAARSARSAVTPQPAPRSAAGTPVEQLSDLELLESVLNVVLAKRKRHNEVDARKTAAAWLRDRGLGGLAHYLRLMYAPNEETPQKHSALERSSLSLAELGHLAAVIELGRRVCRSPLLGRRLQSHTDVQAWASGRLTDLEHEEVWVLAVSSSSRVMGERRVGQGGLHGCGLLPSDILRPVLRAGAPALALVHNHPSGDPTPSREDVVMTKTLQAACQTLGVILLDHVIVSRNGSCSLAECGFC